MSNRFFSFVNQLISGSVARSSDVNEAFQSVDTGFDTVEAELNRSIKLSVDEDTSEHVITTAAANRLGFVVGFDDNGDLVVSKQWYVDWNAAGFRLRNLPDAIETDEPVTYGQLTGYTTSLVTGMPPIVGQTGALITDGASVSWSPIVPGSTPDDAGRSIVYASGEARWLLSGTNRVADPNGLYGTTYWTTDLDPVENDNGNEWRSTGTLTSYDGEHIATIAGSPTAGANVEFTASVFVDMEHASAGTADVAIRFFDVSDAELETSASTTVNFGDAPQRAAITATSPAGTVKASIVVVFAGVDAAAGEVILRDAKLEVGAYATPFNDARTLAIAAGSAEQTYVSAGFANPVQTLGDDSASTSSRDFRSAAGTQDYDVRIKSTGGTTDTDGKGALTIESKTMSNTGPIGYAAEYDAGNSGASKTIDFAAHGSRQKLTLSAATPAITISTTGLVVGHYMLKIIQDSTPRVPVWTGFSNGNVAGNAAPTLAQSSGGVTFLSLYWDGAAFWVTSAPFDA